MRWPVSPRSTSAEIITGTENISDTALLLAQPSPESSAAATLDAAGAPTLTTPLLSPLAPTALQTVTSTAPLTSTQLITVNNQGPMIDPGDASMAIVASYPITLVQAIPLINVLSNGSRSGNF